MTAVAAGFLVWVVLTFDRRGAAQALGRILARYQRRSRASEDDVIMLAELVMLGLTAGLPFPAALEAAASEVPACLATEVNEVVRRMRRRGSAAGLAGSDGRAAGLYRPAGAAVASGASLVAAVETFIANARAERRTEALIAARRLPVRLLFPLALLILPGLVVLVAGSALVESFDRFAGP